MKLAQKIILLNEMSEPKAVQSIWDNGGKTTAQYTVVVDDKWSGYNKHKDSNAMSKDTHMVLCVDGEGGRKFAQWKEDKEGKHLGKKVKWSDLPDETKKYVLGRINKKR